MRIALVTYRLQLGGVEAFLHTLAKHLRDRGHDVAFVETEGRGIWSDATRNLGFEVASVSRRSLRTRLEHARRVASVLRKYDALLINDSPLAMAALNLLPPGTVAIPILHTAMESMIRNATANCGQWQRLVTVAPGLRDQIVRSGRVARDQVVVICNSVPAPPSARVKRAPGEPLRVAYVGRLEQDQKNVLAIPRILAKAQSGGASLRLDVIGEGPDRKRMNTALRELGVPFRFHGQLVRERTLDHFNLTDVLLMPSRYEGLPMALLEAMAKGVTPVVSRLPGSTDYVVTTGRNGVLVEPEFEEGFAAAIKVLERNDRLLDQMSQEAEATVRNHFSSEKMAEAYLRLIKACRREVVSRPPKRPGYLDESFLGGYAAIPYAFVRPWRKTRRLLCRAPPARCAASESVSH